MPSSTRRASDRYEGSSASDSDGLLDPQFELPRRERRRSRTKHARSDERRQSRSRSRGGSIREEHVLGTGHSSGGYGPIAAPRPTFGARPPNHQDPSRPQSHFDFTDEEDYNGRGGAGRRSRRRGTSSSGGTWWEREISRPICGKYVSHSTLVIVGVVSRRDSLSCQKA